MSRYESKVTYDPSDYKAAYAIHKALREMLQDEGKTMVGCDRWAQRQGYGWWEGRTSKILRIHENEEDRGYNVEILDYFVIARYLGMGHASFMAIMAEVLDWEGTTPLYFTEEQYERSVDLMDANTRIYYKRLEAQRKEEEN